MIIEAFLKALGQIGDARFRNVLLTGIGLTIAGLFAVSAVFIWGVGLFIGDSLTLPWIGTIGWVDTAWQWAAIPLMVVLSVFLMVPVASVITSFFLDDVAQAVEDKHYPHLGQGDEVPFGDALRDTVSFLGVLIVANLFALILYVIFIPLAPFIFWAVNGFLLGREYFTIAAMRRVGRVEAKRLRRKHFVTIWGAGILMAVPLAVPLINLIIPVLGAATFTHVYHRLQGANG